MEEPMDDKIVLPEPPAELLQQPDEQPEPEPAAHSEPVSQAEEVDAGSTGEATEQLTQDTPVKKGEGNRIKELVQANKTLQQRLAEITQVPFQPTAAPYVSQVQAGQELTMEQYQTDVAKTAEARIELRLAQERAINRVNSESVDAIRKYPELDPSSDVFDQDLSDAVVEATEAAVRVNPFSASVLSVVDKFMKPYQKAAQREVSQVTKTVARQVSDAAMRPTAVRQPEKPANEKSMDELERELGIVHS